MDLDIGGLFGDEDDVDETGLGGYVHTTQFPFQNFLFFYYLNYPPPPLLPSPLLPFNNAPTQLGTRRPRTAGKSLCSNRPQNGLSAVLLGFRIKEGRAT
jgi:hypothetical protein